MFQITFLVVVLPSRCKYTASREVHTVAGRLRVLLAFPISPEVAVMFALRMVTLATLLVMYKASPVLGIAALSIGAGYILGQRIRRPATASR